MTNELLQTHYLVAKRYQKIVSETNMQNKEHWITYLETALTLTNTDKLSRWIGFMQGVLFFEGIITISEERNITRNIYKPAYDNLGLDSKTVEVYK